MFFKCITVVARLCVVAVVKLCFIIAVLFFLLLKAVVIALQVLNTPRHNQTGMHRCFNSLTSGCQLSVISFCR